VFIAASFWFHARCLTSAAQQKQKNEKHKTHAGGLGARMEVYRIRIVKNGQEITAQACKQASDYAAVRHAKSMAENSDHMPDYMEVWRGAHCVFTGSPAERDN
jgi:hypothetical protein